MGALLTPAFGTVFWATIAFLTVLFILRKVAWGPILKALSERERASQTLRRLKRLAKGLRKPDNERLLEIEANRRNVKESNKYKSCF